MKGRIYGKKASESRSRQRGSSLFIVATALVAFIGLMGIAIDLVSLYLGKSEAQRAADAAALAGATVFVTTGCTSTSAGCAAAQALATTQAVTVGQTNFVAGATPSIPNGNVSFDLSHAGDPLITVVVNATLPTYFMRIFGVTSANIAATATAEAFNPSGNTTGPTLCVSCLKPFLVPNCDPLHLSPANAGCTGGAGGNSGGAFIVNGAIAHPGAYPAGVIGEPWTLHSVGSPSQYYELAIGGQSKNQFESNVQFCNTNVVITCGDTLNTLNGNAVGPNGHAVGCLITYGATCNSQTVNATDSIVVNAGATPPWTITAGAGNPFFPAGSTITQSASIITAAVYDGHALNPGGDTVTIIGYLQFFIKDVAHHGSGGGQTDDIDTIIMNVTTCGAGGGTCGAGGSGQGTGGTVAGGGAGFVPVRLVHP
jgi:Putative Flp pilus-assembly TadE/G-like